jgi:hypothetical protein
MSYKSWITVLQLHTIFIVLQVVADSKSRFVFIDIGAKGKQSGGGTFFGSTLYHFLKDSESSFKKPASFGGSGKKVPFVILGDKAIPLKTPLMKPFARKDLSCEEPCFQLQAVASKEMRSVCLWYPNSKMAIVKQSNIN